MLDKEQAAAVAAKENKVIVVAGAGSGKTRVITERIKHLLNSGVKAANIVCITFTNMAADEMVERLQGVAGIGDAFIGTIHSFANKVLKCSENDSNFEIFNEEHNVNFHKYLINRYCKHIVFDRWLQYMDIKKDELCGRKDEGAADAFLTPAERAELMLINRKHEDIPLGDDYPKSVDSLCKARNIITFDELLEKAVRYFDSHNMYPEYVLVDELQDIGTLEYSFIRSLRAKNYFFVGDDWQCQPYGTKIMMADGKENNIEDLNVGDLIMKYSSKGGSRNFSNPTSHALFNHCVTDIYRGTAPIIKVSAGNYSSRYTPNHRAIIKLIDEPYGYVVYLMRNAKGQIRVGHTQLWHRGKSGGMLGLRGRMQSENCKEGWILGWWPTKEEAFINEQKISLKYAIPQIIFQGSKYYTSKSVDSIYSCIGNYTARAEECLRDFGRDIKYPFLKVGAGRHYSRNNIVELEACNIIPRIMQVAVYDKNNTRVQKGVSHVFAKYEIISSVEYMPEAPIVGITTSSGMYIADRILTHNSIYSFKGGNVEIFKSLVQDKRWKSYWLNNNYRNSKAVMNVADRIISQVGNKLEKQIERCNKSQGGVIVETRGGVDNLLKSLAKEEKDFGTWFFLVRTNKQVYELMEKCKEHKVPAITFKREGMSLEAMRGLLKSNVVKILTVHASKGLEADNVLLYGNFPIEQPPYFKNEEERKVMYVGVTRAKENLIILN